MEFLDIDYKTGVLQYFGVTALYVFPAIVVGVLCEKITRHIQINYELSALIMIIIQLFLATLFLYIIEYYLSPKYGSNWQEITPGLFFVSIFFGLQSSLYANVFSVAQM